MTIALPIEYSKRNIIGVLQAEVNLKYVLEVVSNIKPGKAGYAYAVTRSGDLIAHPDISLVLQRRNMAQLNQVKEAFKPLLSKTIQNLLFTVFETKHLGRIKRSSGLRLSVIVLSNLLTQSMLAVGHQGRQWEF